MLDQSQIDAPQFRDARPTPQATPQAASHPLSPAALAWLPMRVHFAMMAHIAEAQSQSSILRANARRAAR